MFSPGSKAIVVAVVLLIIPTPLFAEADVGNILSGLRLQHEWLMNCSASQCSFKSAYKPPPPFGAKNEAVMTVAAVPYKSGSKMDAILSSEVKSIRDSFEIDTSAAEDDGRVYNKGVATWTERIGNEDVGFIKYRAYSKNAPPPHFFTSIHCIVLVAGQEFLVNLMSFYAGHQDEVRADQIAVVKALSLASQK
jgi:hypothetical protein